MTVSLPTRSLLAGVGLATLASPALAQFVEPDGSNYPWVRGSTANSLYAQWERFTSPSGPNAPDVGSFVGGTLPPEALAFAAFDAAWQTSGSFITSGGNIYSFSGIVEPQVNIPGFGLGDGFDTPILVQFRTQGVEADYDNILLNGVIEPVEVTELFRDTIGGPFGGALVDFLVRFEVEGNATAYDVTFAAASSSLSLDRVAVDAFAFAVACDADLDGDGSLTVFDFLEFQNLFASGDLAADFNGDGSLDLFDFLAFQNAFDTGC